MGTGSFLAAAVASTAVASTAALDTCELYINVSRVGEKKQRSEGDRSRPQDKQTPLGAALYWLIKVSSLKPGRPAEKSIPHSICWWGGASRRRVPRKRWLCVVEMWKERWNEREKEGETGAWR